MPLLTLKILASLLQMHGPDAVIKSDNQGINELLGNVHEQITEEIDSNMVIPVADKAVPKADPATPGATSRSYRKGFGRTIFRKGGYDKSVYGPQFKNIILNRPS